MKPPYKPTTLSVYLITKPISDVKDSYYMILEKALSAGISALQFREKSGSTRVLYQHAKVVQRMASAYHTPFIINDRLDLALALEADGLHVGQDDLPAKRARKLIGPNKILGVSAGSLKEAVQAEADGADYLGVGAVFPTGTKKDATSISMEAFREICQSVAIPVVAIGGITQENVPLLKEKGAEGVAVISAVWEADDPMKAVNAFKNV